ncbi:MAG TPA: guanylate kinase [Bacilli bacterium]
MYTLKDTEMIFVFTGPDGSGRRTVADMVGATLGIKKVLSCTTREPRPTELDGQDYHFISEESFLQAKENGEFVESVNHDGNWYGIKHKHIEQMFEENAFIYLVISASGARTLKKIYGDKVTRIFIYADREKVMERQRLLGATDRVVQSHVEHYDDGMAYHDECKYAFENDDLAHTVFAVTNILEEVLDRGLVDKD